MNEKILEEYCVKVYEIDPNFYEHYKEKIKVDKNECEYILFRVDAYFIEYFLAVEIDEQDHESRGLIFEKKKRHEVLEKKLGCIFIRINTSDTKEVMIQTMKLVKYKYLLVNLKKKNKRTRRRNKKIKTLINKSKCISCQKMFYQITRNEEHTITNKTNKNLKKTWNNKLFRV